MASGVKGNIDWSAVMERYIEGATWEQLRQEFHVSTGSIRRGFNEK